MSGCHPAQILLLPGVPSSTLTGHKFPVNTPATSATTIRRTSPGQAAGPSGREINYSRRNSLKRNPLLASLPAISGVMGTQYVSMDMPAPCAAASRRCTRQTSPQRQQPERHQPLHCPTSMFLGSGTRNQDRFTHRHSAASLLCSNSAYPAVVRNLCWYRLHGCACIRVSGTLAAAALPVCNALLTHFALASMCPDALQVVLVL